MSLLAQPAAMAGEARPRYVRLAPLGLAVAGLAGSLLLLASLRAAEVDAARAEWERRATVRMSAVYRSFESTVEQVYSTVALFDSSEAVEPDEFATFTERLMLRHAPLRAFLWLTRTNGGPLAVTYSVGDEADTFRPGSRPANELGLGPAIEQSRTSAALVLSPAFRVDGGPPRVLVLLPVLDERLWLEGVAAGVVDVQRLLSSAEEPAEGRLSILDVSEEPPRLLAGAPVEPDDGPSQSIEKGGRSWRVCCQPPDDVLAGATTWRPWGMFVLGLVATGLLVATVATATSRARVQGLVERRTREVMTAYQRLSEQAQEKLTAVAETDLLERRLRQILDLVPDMIYVKDWYGSVLLANEATARALGTSVDELVAEGGFDLSLSGEHPEEVLRRERRLMETGGSYTQAAHPFVDAEGRQRTLRTVKIPCTAFGKDVRALLCISSDITASKRDADMLRCQNHLLAALAQGVGLDELLGDLVAAAERIVPHMRCSILLLDRERGTLRHGAAPSLPEAYNRAIDGLSIGPTAGSCGAAAHLKERVVVADVMEHPNWEPYRDLARLAGIRASWSQPILSTEGATLGTFAMYYDEPRAPETWEEGLIESLARLAGLAIERGGGPARLGRESRAS